MTEFTREELQDIGKILREKISRKSASRFSSKEVVYMLATEAVIKEILDDFSTKYPYDMESYREKFMRKIINLQPAERPITRKLLTEIQDWKDTIRLHWEPRVDAGEKAYARVSRELSEAKETITKRDEEIAELKKTLQTRDEEIAALKQTISDLGVRYDDRLPTE